jgi:hypothetical protein
MRGAARDAFGRLTRHSHLWLPGYAWSRLRRLGQPPPRHVWLAITDHFEPLWRKPDDATARGRVALWRRTWPEIASRHGDADGRRPVYCCFYPEEEYRPELVEPLAEMARQGIVDVEVHIHHDGEGEAWFADTVGRFVETLESRHGLLRRHRGRPAFGFIHGNWALDNSRPDGRWCGLDNEITLLRDLGCYADFTMPAAFEPCQAGPVNEIYRVTDDPRRPRSYARGVVVQPGLAAVGDLTMITGPLGLEWRGLGRKPRVESGEIAGNAMPSRARARLWLSLAPRVGEHAFVKLFTHGTQERNSGPLLSGGLDLLFESLEAECRAVGARHHFVSAWEAWKVVEALRVGSDPLAAAGCAPSAA